MRILPLLLLLLTACSKPDAKCTDYRVGSGSARILAFGDSQTTGHGDETSEGCGFSYANQLSLDKSSSLENYAVGGTEFVSDQEFGALMSAPLKPTDRIVMLIGFNDMRAFGTDPEHLADFKQALTNALRRVSPLVKSVTIATVLDPINYGLHGGRNAVDAYRLAVHQVVSDLSLPNVSAFDPVLDRNPNYFVEDQTHLNRSGQAILAEQFERNL